MKIKDYEKYDSWCGLDVSLKISLCEYGFIMEWNKSHNKFDVIVRDDHNFHKQPMYCHTSFDFEQWIEELSEDRSWVNLDEVLDFIGADSKEEYLAEATPINLLSDLMSYYGKTNILGEDYSFQTLEEITKDWELYN